MLGLEINKVYQFNLDNIILNNQKRISSWLNDKKIDNMPLYASVDIRNSGFKISPIDTNLFPSGFNNISNNGLNDATKYFSEYIKRNFPNTKKIGLISEQFTRNLNYNENLKILFNVLKNTNLEVRLLTITEDINNTQDLSFFKFKKQNSTILTDDNWSPDLIILNNDLTEKVPEKLMNLSIPILPNIKYGWHTRRKCLHYKSYNKLVDEFCLEFNIDSWLMSTYYSKCSNINFKRKEGLECIAKKIDELATKIQNKYDEYQIQQEPFVFIKANNGTFGRGIISVKNGQEIININKKLRHSLSTIKGNVANSEVIIQEGIPTIERYNNYPAENVIYLVGSNVIGKFTRFNTAKGVEHNLNSKGMLFTKSKKITPSEFLLSKLANISVIHEEIQQN